MAGSRNIAPPVPPGASRRTVLHLRSGVRATSQISLPIRARSVEPWRSGGLGVGNQERQKSRQRNQGSDAKTDAQKSHPRAATPSAPPPKNPACHQADALPWAAEESVLTMSPPHAARMSESATHP